MVDFLSVIVAAIVGFIICAIYYGALFGKAWKRLSGIKHGRPPWHVYIIDILALIIVAYVLGIFIDYVALPTLGVIPWTMGLYLGFLVWLGFIATTTLGMVTWERKPFSLWLLTNICSLISFAVMGIILAVW